MRRLRTAFARNARWLTPILALAAFVGWRQCDFTGTEQALTRVAINATSRFISIWYPKCLIGCAAPRQLGRDQVSVALYGSEFTSGHKPDYAKLIDRLVAYGAREIVFDIVLQDRPDDPAAIQRIAHSIAAAQHAPASHSRPAVPVVLAQRSDRSATNRLCHGENRPDGRLAWALNCTAAAVGMIDWAPGVGDMVYPLQERHYGQRVNSLAWAAYLADLRAAAGGKPVPEAVPDRKNMFLAWGQAPDGFEPGCSDAGPVNDALVDHLTALGAVFFRGHSYSPDACTYIPHFAVERLVDDRLAGGSGAEIMQARARLPISGRVVFVGVGDPAVQDLAHPPNGPVVAGVFTHATAFDNLLTLGLTGYYRYYVPQWLGISRDTLLGILPLALTLGCRLAGVAELIRRIPGPWLRVFTLMLLCDEFDKRDLGPIAGVLAAASAYLFSMLILMLLGVWVLEIALANCLVVVVFSTGLELMLALQHSLVGHSHGHVQSPGVS